MSSSKEQRRLTLMGVGLMLMGAAVSLLGGLLVHFTGSPELNSLGEPIFTAFPRSFILVAFAQIVSLSGVLILLAGMVVAFVYQRDMTWARASIAAFVFTSVSMILFGIIPNQWLTFAQAELQWDGSPLVSFIGCPEEQRLACLTLPGSIVGGNQLEISWAALKDAISGGYAVAALGGVAVAIVKMQTWAKDRRDAPPPAPISEYGRPLSIAEES